MECVCVNTYIQNQPTYKYCIEWDNARQIKNEASSQNMEVWNMVPFIENDTNWSLIDYFHRHHYQEHHRGQSSYVF